jgi:hypothetical protein
MMFSVHMNSPTAAKPADPWHRPPVLPLVSVIDRAAGGVVWCPTGNAEFRGSLRVPQALVAHPGGGG